MLAFWQEALHYIPREPAKDGWVVLRDPEGRNPNVSLNQDPKKRLGRNRLHLDLYTDNREDEVKRLLKIGATRHPQTYETDDDFVVLEDPDGNLFCVVQKDTDESRISRTQQGTRIPAYVDSDPTSKLGF
jgi:catechol 2,3-dioxygenase-like lactoylglutathione lyase family enzyme